MPDSDEDLTRAYENTEWYWRFTKKRWRSGFRWGALFGCVIVLLLRKML